jgi:hypothetical protein
VEVFPGDTQDAATVENKVKELREQYGVKDKKDERIRAHVFLYMLADYLLWHFMERLEPFFARQRDDLAAGRISPKERALTLEGVLKSLKSLRRNRVRVAGSESDQVCQPDARQRQVLDLLAVKLPGLP